MMRRPGSLRRGETGQSLVEFALILPLLLGLIVGIFEFGSAWRVYQVITNTAREGARVGVVPTGSQVAVQAAIDQGLMNGSLDPSLATVSILGVSPGNDTGTPATIQLSYPYQFQFIGPIVAFLQGPDDSMTGGITLSTTVVMRNE